jgi:hypothetical protein
VSYTGLLYVRVALLHVLTYSRNALDDSDLLAKSGGEREDLRCSGFKQFDFRAGCPHLEIPYKVLERGEEEKWRGEKKGLGEKKIGMTTVEFRKYRRVEKKAERWH